MDDASVGGTGGGGCIAGIDGIELDGGGGCIAGIELDGGGGEATGGGGWAEPAGTIVGCWGPEVTAGRGCVVDAGRCGMTGATVPIIVLLPFVSWLMGPGSWDVLTG